MELLFVLVLAAGIGAVLRYVLPRRSSHGMLLLPAIAAATAAIVWVALTWLGWAWDGGWIWVLSLTLGGVATLITGLVLPGRRAAADERLFQQLSNARA